MAAPAPPMPAARAEPGTAARTPPVWAESDDTRNTSSKTVTQKRRAEPSGTVMLDDVARRFRATPLLDAFALLQTQHVETGPQRRPQRVSGAVREQQREANGAGRLLGDVVAGRPA